MSSKPEMRYGGVTKAATEPMPYQATQSKSAHILFSFILAGRGTHTPTMVDATGFSSIYGSGALLAHEHHTHQSKFLEFQLRTGHAVVKRIILPDAKKATLRVSLEIIPAYIPIYKVDSDWRPIYNYDDSTGMYSKIVIGMRKAHRALIHIGTDMYPTQSRDFGLGSVANYRLGSTIGFNGTRLDGETIVPEVTETSKLYPLFDMELADYGEFGNAVTMSVTEFVDALTGYDSAMANITIREGNTPMVNSDGIAETAFSLTPVADSNVALPRAIQQSFMGGYNPLIGRIKTYDDEIAIVSKLLASEENALVEAAITLNDHVTLSNPHGVEFNTTDSSAFMFNILTGKNNLGINYINGDLGAAENFNGKVLTEGESYAFIGGSDGYPYTETGELDKLQQLRLYDEAVRGELKSMATAANPYVNMSRFPYTVWYDSGYAMDTKLAAFNILKHRPEVTVIQTPHSVAEYGNEVIIPEISCAGATNSTGTITLEGTFDIYAGKTLVLADATPEQYLNYLEGTGNFKGTVTPDEVPWTITCAGAIEYADFLMYVVGTPESVASLNNSTFTMDGVSVPESELAQCVEPTPRQDIVPPPIDGYSISMAIRWKNLRNVQTRFEIITDGQVGVDGKPYALFKPLVGGDNPTVISNAESTRLGMCLSPSTAKPDTPQNPVGE